MLRILYVEDNAANLSLVYRVAQMGGHEVTNRSTGEQALADFDSIKPDLVLMDVQLEGKLTGLDVTKQLRERGYTLPIVAVTAYAMTGDKEKALAAGCDDYLPKPLPIKQLVTLLKHYEQLKHEKKISSKTVPTVSPKTDLANPDKATVVAPTIQDHEKTITTEAARELDPNATTTVEAAQELDPNPTVTARATDANDVVEVEKVSDESNTEDNPAVTPPSTTDAGQEPPPTSEETTTPAEQEPPKSTTK